MNLPNERDSDIKLSAEDKTKQKDKDKDKNKHNLNACIDGIAEYTPYIFITSIGNPVQTYVANIIVKLPAGYDLNMAAPMISLTQIGAANSSTLVYTINTTPTPPACSGPVIHALQIPAASFNNIDFLQIVIVHLGVTKGKTTTYKNGV